MALAGIVLVYAPATLEVTFTVIKQTPLGLMVPLFSVSDPEPLTAVSEAPAPQPLKVAPTGLASTTPAGRVSVNVVWVKGTLGSVLLTAIVN